MKHPNIEMMHFLGEYGHLRILGALSFGNIDILQNMTQFPLGILTFGNANVNKPKGNGVQIPGFIKNLMDCMHISRMSKIIEL